MRLRKNQSNATESNEETQPESLARRNLLRVGGIAAAGAAAAAVASAVDASPAGATQGNMQYGLPNDAGGDPTKLQSTNPSYTLDVENRSSGSALLAQSFDGSGSAIRGASYGGSVSTIKAEHLASGVGVEVSDGGVGTGGAVSAHLDHATNGSDVVAATSAGTGRVIHANIANSGSSANTVEALNAGTGVSVMGLSDGGGTGVYGKSGALPSGYNPTGGVVGSCAAAIGVVGSSDTNVGVKARSVSGNALDVSGKVHFSRSGVVSITGTAKSAVVTPTGPALVATSMVIAVLQTNQAGVWVASAVPNVPAGKLTINLNVAPGTGHTVKVAWLVLG